MTMRILPISLLCAVLFICLPYSIVTADSSIYRLAFRSTTDKEIWTINSDGTDARQITHDGADKEQIIASPDGHYIAYYAQTWYDNANYLIYHVAIVLDIATGEQRMVTGQEAINGLTWSPDSQNLLFAVLTHHEDYSPSYELVRINRDGTDRAQLTNSTFAGSGLSWSPDGKHIVVSRQNKDSSYQITMLNADGSNPQELLHLDSCFICQPPRWTPDGQSIIYYSHPNLFILDVTSHQTRQLTDFAQVYNVIDVAYARYGSPEYAITADSQHLFYTMGYPFQFVKLDLSPNSWQNRHVIVQNTNEIFRGFLLLPDEQSVIIPLSTSDGLIHILRDLRTGATQPLITNAAEMVLLN